MKIAITCAALLLAGAAPALAGGDTTTVADAQGDANGINDGGEHHTGNAQTPTSDPHLDLLGVRLAPVRTQGKRTGFTVTFITAAPLRDRGQVTFTGRASGCGIYNFSYAHDASAPQPATLHTSCGGTTRVQAVVDGDRVTITVPLSDLPAGAAKDRVLQRVNAYSQMHVARRDDGRPLGTNMLDTTIKSGTFKFR